MKIPVKVLTLRRVSTSNVLNVLSQPTLQQPQTRVKQVLREW
jgi:hypothetical protein